MNNLDLDAFFKTTGVDFYSKQGVIFREIAVKSLNDTKEDINKEELCNKDSAHRIKGISQSCGNVNIIRICAKLEQYDEIIMEKRSKKILVDICDEIVKLCDL
ncbi:hypothetical protein A9261_15105 [Vibrio tasmaniensis]|nr:hypothetical protein A9261_15105 [Vibrio tasmaniensis]